MKIGILTFHWATNYGAVLQCYALQIYLEAMGHEVHVVNYKPRLHDYTLWNYIRFRRFLHHNSYINSKRKEKVLQRFRDQHLNLTSRIYKKADIPDAISDYGMVISGSDQILNPSFLLNGEGRRKVSTAYFLDFPFKGKKIGYAVSFGCTKYPERATTIASRIINQFDRIGTRENSGLDILSSMQYQNEMEVVPDPTILCYKELFKKIEIQKPQTINYYCAYILHKKIEVNVPDVFYIDEENNPLTMEAWLGAITSSKGLITNSYHGMIVALLNRIPFVVLTVTTGATGMNDRLSTLLQIIGLEDRMCSENDNYMSILSNKIDWVMVETKIKSYSEIGSNFLKIK